MDKLIVVGLLPSTRLLFILTGKQQIAAGSNVVHSDLEKALKYSLVFVSHV